MSDMDIVYKDLTDQQREGAIMAAKGHTCKEISIRLNVRPETVSRWKHVPNYQNLVYLTAEEARQAMVKRMDCLVEQAMDALEATLSRWDEPKLRLQAAIKILEMGILHKKACLSEDTQ